MNISRSQHSCTLLNDGRVLVAGGDADGSGSAEILDPATNEWLFIAGTGEARRGHTATLLGDGRVLLAGGTGTDGPLDSLELVDPVDLSLISSDPALLEARAQHAAALLPDGRVLVIGGTGESGVLASTEIFDPRDFSLIAGPKLSIARAGLSATRLDDGRILVAGGSDGSSELNTAELFAPGEASWATLPVRLNAARRDHLAILIPGNGGVLLAGGLQSGQPLAATEIFLPIENQFLALGSLTLPRYGVAVAAVDNGVILAAGGRNADGPQSACGLLTVPSVQFVKPLFHVPESASASGSSFPPNTPVTFKLEFLKGTTVINGSSRLLTSSVTTPPAGSFILRVNFAAVPILTTIGLDAGLTARLTASTPGGVTAVGTTLIRNATSLSLNLPATNYEGFSATVLAQLVRPPSNGAMTGTMSITVGTPATQTISDGSSNTIIIGETNSGTTTTPVNTTSNSVFVSKGLTALTAGVKTVTASYSGDAANDPANASGTFTVASKTPTLQLSAPTLTPQVGTSINVNATVQTDPTVSNPRPLTGSVNFLTSGFSLGPGVGVATSTQLTSALAITPLTLDPISLSATYSGDSFFRNTASKTLTLAVQKANPTLTIDNAPATYTCGQPSTFNVTLSFPLIGLTNRIATLSVLANDGSVRSVGLSSSASGTLPSPNLVVIPPGIKDTQSKATGTLTGILPLDITGVVATFSGDSLLTATNSAVVRPAAQLSPTSVSLVNLPSTLTNPAVLTARVVSPSCSAIPTGAFEFLDGTATLAVVQIGNNLQQFGAILPVFASPASVDGQLTVSRPPGTHTLSVRYSGDRHYQPSTSAPVSVVFQ
jgi:hypothetical protein